MSDLIEVGGVWLNEKDGKKYLSGYLGKAKVLLFKNEHKSEDRHPDYRMYFAKGKDQLDYEAKKSSTSSPQGGRQDSPPPADDDVPF